MSTFNATSVQDAADQYGAAGWAPIPLLPKSKRPFDTNWPERDYVADGIDVHFSGDVNVGLKCGSPSQGLVDVDIDDRRALKIADRFLPPTELRHGRAASRNSHRWYAIDGDLGSTCQFRDPTKQEGDDKTMLIEYRSTGAQTVVPPSVHPSGEALSWDEFGVPTAVAAGSLQQAVRQVAAVALIARHWPNQGGRNDAAMALSGGLLRGGMNDDAAERFVQAVADAAGDEEADERVKAVHSSRKKIDACESVTGWPSLSKLIGDVVAKRAFEWLQEAEIIRAAVEWESPIVFSEQVTPDIHARLLPKTLADFAEALAAEFEVPQTLSVMATLGTAATAVSNKVVIELKPNWQEPLNLYLATALPPGSNKTAVLNRCTRPLVDWEASERMTADPVILQAKSTQKSEQQHIEAQRRKAAKEKDPLVRRTLYAHIAQLEAQLTQVPPYPRLFGNDLTPEALAVALHEQGGRFAIISDEGGITETLAGLYSEGAANIDVLLKGIDGGYVRINRKSGDPIELQPYLTLALAVQLRILQNMGRKRTFQGNGALERFLFTVPKSNLGYRKLQGAPVPAQVGADYCACIRKLLALTPRMPERFPVPHVLTLSPEAEQVFAGFRAEVEQLMRPSEKLHEISGWGGKLPGFTARIAGLMHVSEHGVNQTVVSDATLQAAIDLARLLIEHAVAAWQLMGGDQASDDAKRVFEWIKAGKLDRFTRTDCLKANRGINSSKRMDQLLTVLTDRNILGQPQKADSHGRGRRPTEYLVNPLVHAH